MTDAYLTELERRLIRIEKTLVRLQLIEIINKQAAIVNADGTLADITTKFNTLLTELETAGILTP